MITAMTDAMTELASFELLSLECRTGSNGTLRYYNAQGQLHRVHGPAVEYSDGSYEWRYHGLLHRLDGPAVESSDVYREWCQNGRRHRLDGPAVEWTNGSKFWYINGVWLTKATWHRQVASMEAV